MRAKLFVGNLNYETTIDKLEAVFRPFAGYLHTKVCSCVPFVSKLLSNIPLLIPLSVLVGWLVVLPA